MDYLQKLISKFLYYSSLSYTYTTTSFVQIIALGILCFKDNLQQLISRSLYYSSYPYTHTTAAVVDITALGVHGFVVDGERRVVDHGHNGHGHVRPHDVRVRHAEEQHECHPVPSAEAAWERRYIIN